jgi:hypothetical protein
MQTLATAHLGLHEMKAASHKTLAGSPQARRKSVPEENGKEENKSFCWNLWKNGPGRKQQFQTGGFTPFSDRR